MRRSLTLVAAAPSGGAGPGQTDAGGAAGDPGHRPVVSRLGDSLCKSRLAPDEVELSVVTNAGRRCEPSWTLLVNLPVPDGQATAAGPARDAVEEHVRDGLGPVAAAVSLLVETEVQWSSSRTWTGTEAAPGPKLVSLLRRRPGVETEQFRRHWRDTHAPLARDHHPGVARYVQHHVVDPGEGAAPGDGIDGVAELYFPSETDRAERAFASEESRAIIEEDMELFIDTGRICTLLTREYLWPCAGPAADDGRGT